MNVEDLFEEYTTLADSYEKVKDTERASQLINMNAQVSNIVTEFKEQKKQLEETTQKMHEYAKVNSDLYTKLNNADSNRIVTKEQEIQRKIENKTLTPKELGEQIFW